MNTKQNTMSQQDERNRWSENVEEDAPQMMSVAMLSHVPTTPLLHNQHAPFALKTAAVGGVEGKGLGEFGLKSKQTTQDATPLDIKVTTIKSWNVTKLLSIPFYHQLERTSVTVSADVSLKEVTNRLMDIFHSASIAVVYYDDEAKAIAETKECVKFAVRLWSSSSEQVVVECQRFDGCSTVFMKVAKKVLKAARDGKKAQSSDNKKTSLNMKTIPSAVRDCIPNIPQDVMKDSVQDCVQISNEMIASARLDEQQLGIESLLHISESYKSQDFCALMIMSNSVILKALISLVVYGCLDHNNSFASDLEKVCYSVMRRHSLTVLANCLKTLNQSKMIGNFLMDGSALVADDFLKALVRFVASGATTPHEAADACKCLHMLCSHSITTKQRVCDYGTQLYVKHAQDCRHATLNDASTNLLVALSS